MHLTSTVFSTFCGKTCNSLWPRFNKILKTLFKEFGSCLLDSITLLFQICQLTKVALMRSSVTDVLHIQVLFYILWL